MWRSAMRVLDDLLGYVCIVHRLSCSAFSTSMRRIFGGTPKASINVKRVVVGGVGVGVGRGSVVVMVVDFVLVIRRLCSCY